VDPSPADRVVLVGARVVTLSDRERVEVGVDAGLLGVRVFERSESQWRVASGR
jgi:hypothetical protein